MQGTTAVEKVGNAASEVYGLERLLCAIDSLASDNADIDQILEIARLAREKAYRLAEGVDFLSMDLGRGSIDITKAAEVEPT